MDKWVKNKDVLLRQCSHPWLLEIDRRIEQEVGRSTLQGNMCRSKTWKNSEVSSITRHTTEESSSWDCCPEHKDCFLKLTVVPTILSFDNGTYSILQREFTKHFPVALVKWLIQHLTVSSLSDLYDQHSSSVNLLQMDYSTLTLLSLRNKDF